MPLSVPRKELKQLTLFMTEIDRRYLAPHTAINTLAPPTREEELDVAAFAVLAHGALENFVEGLSLWAVNRVQANWIRKRASRSTVVLLRGTSPTVDFAKETSTVFNLIRTSIDEAKTAHSSRVEGNNGIALKHLRRLLLPVGIDVPTDPVLVGSLDALIKMRHDWAHQYRHGAKTSKSAADVRKTAQDCVALAEQLCKGALSLRL